MKRTQDTAIPQIAHAQSMIQRIKKASSELVAPHRHLNRTHGAIVAQHEKGETFVLAEIRKRASQIVL